MIEAIPVPAFLISRDDKLVAANALFRSIFPDFNSGRTYLTLLRQPTLVALVENLKIDAPSKPIEISVRTHSNDLYSVSGASLEDGLILICLQNTNETATAVQLRREFIADLSHELKTPLTAMSSILETSEGDPAALAQFLPVLSGEVDRMNRLVTDLLALSRVVSNERRVPDQEVIVQRVIEEACTPLKALAKKSNVTIETDMASEPIRILGDADELVRAVSNLVENAVRYGASGEPVRVCCKVNAPDAVNKDPTVSIAVCNSGSGVEDHHIPRLTERFYRVDTHRSRDSGGSGLGLAIVKHVATHHRGRLAFESTPDKDFLAKLTLPLEQS